MWIFFILEIYSKINENLKIGPAHETTNNVFCNGSYTNRAVQAQMDILYLERRGIVLSV